MNGIAVMVRSECRARSRRAWTIGGTAALATLSAGLTLASAGIAQEAGYDPSIGGLINLFLLVVPLLALVLGSLSIARDKERGTLAYLRAQPVSLGQIFWSKWLVVMLQISVTVSLAFGTMLVVLAALHVLQNAGAIAQFGIVTLLLGIVMASCGVFISTLANKTPAALGLAVGAWLALVFFGDLGVMVTALATHMNTHVLLALTMLNPIEAYKIAAVSAISGSIEVLGPGGRLATDTFGGAIMPVMVGVLVAWGTLATLAARYTFR